MKGGKLYLALVAALLAMVVACTPQVTPAPPAPVVQAPTPVAQPPAPPVGRTAWDGVVEAARKEGSVTAYSYNLVGDVGLAVARAFKERHGITLDIITGRGAEQLERLKAERRMGKMVGDVNDGSSLHFINYKKEGLTVGLPERVPVLGEQGVWVADVFGRDPVDKHIASFSFQYGSPWINTKLVKAGEEPQVWRDLLKPQWKGKMTLLDSTVSGAPLTLFVPLMREKVIDEDFLKELYKQDLAFVLSNYDDARMLGRGESLLSIKGSPVVNNRFVADGAPIKAIDMKDGVVTALEPNMVIIPGGPHPNAARVYANWFFSPEGQGVYSKAASVSPIRKGVADPAPEAAQLSPQRPIIETVEDAQKAAQLFTEKWLNKLWGRR